MPVIMMFFILQKKRYRRTNSRSGRIIRLVEEYLEKDASKPK